MKAIILKVKKKNIDIRNIRKTGVGDRNEEIKRAFDER